MLSFELTEKTKYVFFVLSRAWDKETILSSHEESNLRLSVSALRCSTTESQRVCGEQAIHWSTHQIIPSISGAFCCSVCLFLFCFFARLFHPLVSCKETIWVATCKFGRCEYWQTNRWTIDWQVKEHAAHALGFLMVGDENFPHHEKLIDGLCEAAKVLLSSWIIMITETHNSQHRVYCKWEISSFLTLNQ